MKRRNLMKTIGLVTGLSLMMTFLTGCESAQETSAQVSEENIEEFAADDVDTTEDVASEENVDGETDSTEEMVATGTDDEIVAGNIIFYKRMLGRLPDEPRVYKLGSGEGEVVFEPETINKEVMLEYDVPVKAQDGNDVGYIKAGTVFKLIEYGGNAHGGTYRIENTSGIGYEYIYISMNHFITTDDMKEYVLERVPEEFTTIVDSPESDMDYVDFTVDKRFSAGTEDPILENLYRLYDNNARVFCVECTKNGTEQIDIRIYYK